MRDVLARSFAAQLSKLREALVRSLKSASPEASFIHHVFAQMPDQCRPEQLPIPLAPPTISPGIAPDIATIGFLSATNPSDAVVAMYGDWRTSFSRLQNKDPFPIDRQAFTLRPIEFLGTCLGARLIDGATSTAVRWLQELLPEQRRQIQGRWAAWLSAVAGVALTGSDDLRNTVALENSPVDELALLGWLQASQAYSDRGFWKTLDAVELQRLLLERCATEPLDDLDPARAAVMYAALKFAVVQALQSALEERWQISRPEKDARDLATSICRRFHRMARQLQSRHGNRKTLRITDEYDVQDLMHATLSLFFDDVREETWTPNYGGNSSRTDFVLWNERVVVEVKMTRKTLGQKEIANQLIIDKERYNADPRCRTLICFVYDPGGFCKNPVALESDLAQSDSPETIVVVSPR